MDFPGPRADTVNCFAPPVCNRWGSDSGGVELLGKPKAVGVSNIRDTLSSSMGTFLLPAANENYVLPPSSPSSLHSVFCARPPPLRKISSLHVEEKASGTMAIVRVGVRFVGHICEIIFRY